MPDWRFPVTSLRTTAVQGYVPLRDASFGVSLNAPGTFTATLDLEVDDYATTAEYLRLLTAGQCVVHAERDGQIVGDGIVWRPSYASDGSAVALTGDSLLSYLAHRVVDFTARFTDRDQLQIVTDVLNASLDGADGFGLTVPAPTPSGVLRQDTYVADSGRSLLDHMASLAAMSNGFDFAIDTAWNTAGTDITRTLRLGYPRLGVDSVASGASQAHLVYIRAHADTAYSTQASNVDSYTWDPDGAAKANRVVGVARNDDGTSRVHTAATALAATEARLDATETWEVRTQEALVAKTVARLLQATRSQVEPTFTCSIDPDPQSASAQLAAGQWAAGDDVTVTIIDPLRFPGTDQTPATFVGRITAATIRAPSGETPEQVTFSVRPLLTAVVPP